MWIATRLRKSLPLGGWLPILVQFGLHPRLGAFESVGWASAVLAMDQGYLCADQWYVLDT